MPVQGVLRSVALCGCCGSLRLDFGQACGLSGCGGFSLFPLFCSRSTLSVQRFAGFLKLRGRIARLLLQCLDLLLQFCFAGTGLFAQVGRLGTAHLQRGLRFGKPHFGFTQRAFELGDPRGQALLVVGRCLAQRGELLLLGRQGRAGCFQSGLRRCGLFVQGFDRGLQLLLALCRPGTERAGPFLLGGQLRIGGFQPPGRIRHVGGQPFDLLLQFLFTGQPGILEGPVLQARLLQLGTGRFERARVSSRVLANLLEAGRDVVFLLGDLDLGGAVPFLLQFQFVGDGPQLLGRRIGVAAQPLDLVH